MQAFVLQAFGGKWVIDSRIETDSWWGYKMPDRSVAYPEAEEGVGKPTFAWSTTVAAAVQFTTDATMMTAEAAREAGHIWVDHQKVMEDIASRGEASSWHGAKDWIASVQAEQFLVVGFEDDLKEFF
eukprot:COSAG06_NODE_37965_length_429_cov_0.639394_1_plen_126_part_01